jgi:hypothetical protein
MGVKITEDRPPLGPAELANLLTIATDGERMGRVRTSLKVIGIEDVIAEQVASWRTHRVPSAQATTRIQVLVALARCGIGGPFRAGYLQRRLAHDTRGEVAFEATWPGEGTEHDIAPRAMALSNMRAMANAWCVTSGYPAFLTQGSAGHLIYGAPRCIYTDGSIVSQRGSERPRWTIATMLVALSGGRAAVRCPVRVRSRLRF